MKFETTETLAALFGTLGFLFVLLPILIMGFPYIIISSPNHVGNPMYIGTFLVLAGEVLLFQSKDLLIYFLVIFAVINILVLFVEEARLKKRFGASYKLYYRSVRSWIPRLTPYHENDS